MSIIQPIHPFPARMAPEIVLGEFATLPRSAVILDPMAGSGTVLRQASERGFKAIGFDMDPLAVLMARVWNTPIDTNALHDAALRALETAQSLDPSKIELSWIDDDPKTRDFVNYWFGPEQANDLRCLSYVLHQMQGTVPDALRVALSRIIITKDRGASLARDVSHSRPHRVRLSNDFPVFKEFSRSALRLAQQLVSQPSRGRVSIDVGDARDLTGVASASINAVITSPPYLNALDYMRGHRLSLIWFGYQVSALQRIRADSIGAERRIQGNSLAWLASELAASMRGVEKLPSRERGMIDRYVLDLLALITEIQRVLRRNGKAVLVVGNSCIKGVFVENALAVRAAAERAGLRLESWSERELPPNRRYLPPPSSGESSNLEKRMRTETVLKFKRP